MHKELAHTQPDGPARKVREIKKDHIGADGDSFPAGKSPAEGTTRGFGAHRDASATPTAFNPQDTKAGVCPEYTKTVQYGGKTSGFGNVDGK